MSTLYIDRRGVDVELSDEAIVFKEDGHKIGSVPIAPLKRIFIKGNNRIETRLLSKLGERDVAVTILSQSKSSPSLLLSTPHQDALRRITQYQMSLDTDVCLFFSQRLVMDKLQSQLP